MKQILGDNQFFGVNHHDLDKGDKTKDRFSSNESIKEFILEAMKIGLNGFMINSNRRGYDIVKDLQVNNEIEIHYSIPYPHKFASMVNENGLFDLFRYVLINTSFQYLLLKVPQFLFTRNVKHLLPLILDLEIPTNLKKGSFVYLQNVVTDLLIGMKRFDLINSFCKEVIKKGYKPGIITLNPIILDPIIKQFSNDVLQELVVCFNVNIIGYNVFPSKEIVESFAKSETIYKKMGMSILSSGGTTNIVDSLAYINSLSLDYVVYGSSNLSNIKANFKLLV
jgi:hypothetical protein